MYNVLSGTLSLYTTSIQTTPVLVGWCLKDASDSSRAFYRNWQHCFDEDETFIVAVLLYNQPMSAQ